MTETYVYDGKKVVAKFRSGKGGGVDTAAGHFDLMPGPLDGHDITGFDDIKNQPVHAWVGEAVPVVRVGEVIFSFGRIVPPQQIILPQKESNVPLW